MLELNNKKYNLNNRDEREEFHGVIDDLVMEHRTQDLINGRNKKLEDRLSYLHQLISERDELSLDGLWFDCIEIKYWHESITDYLTDMGIEFEQLRKGSIVISIDGEEILLTRDIYTPSLGEFDRYYELSDGVVSEALLNKIGLRPEKAYYLEK